MKRKGPSNIPNSILQCKQLNINYFPRNSHLVFRILSAFISALLLLTLSCQAPRYPQGEALYNHYCASCHMDDGTGLVALYPPLIDSDYLRIHQGEFACIVRYGISHPIKVNDVEFTTPMEGIARINAVEIANIFNYMQSKWYPELSILSEKDVRQQLSTCNSTSKKAQ